MPCAQRPPTSWYAPPAAAAASPRRSGAPGADRANCGRAAALARRPLEYCAFVRWNELLDLIFRWAHLIAGIMWIGNSMLFNWLDRNLEKPPADDAHRLSQGRIYMVHSGAFYDVEKKLLAPGELPERLHWFKWQNGFTWMTGISLLVIVYYANGAAFLIDPNVAALDPLIAITISVSSLLTGWIIYDGLWRTIGERNPRGATVASIAMLFATIYG